MRASVRLLSLLALCLLATGCRKLLARKDAAPTTPPTPVWKENEVTFRELDAKGHFHVGSTRLDVRFESLPAGTALSLGTDRATADGSGRAAVQKDLAPILAKLPPRDAFDFRYRLDPRAKVELEFTGGVKLALDAPRTSVSYAVTEMFKKVVDAPLPLPAPEKAPTEHTVLFLGPGSPEVIGPAPTVDAIDWAALVTNLAERVGKTCSGYTKDKGGSEKSFVLQMVDQRVEVFDVRTSRSIAQREFKAKEECPMMAFSGAAKSYASTDEEKAWLRELRATTK